MVYGLRMTVQVELPDDLIAKIDRAGLDRSEFIASAVERLLATASQMSPEVEVQRINAIAERLNEEAEDVLTYQQIP